MRSEEAAVAPLLPVLVLVVVVVGLCCCWKPSMLAVGVLLGGGEYLRSCLF